jgi:hypothetical protein
VSTPRYVVREVTGCTISDTGATKHESTSWFVLDTEVCYREVGSFYSRAPEQRRGPGGRANKMTRRLAAQELADRLNREHAEWLASPLDQWADAR